MTSKEGLTPCCTYQGFQGQDCLSMPSLLQKQTSSTVYTVIQQSIHKWPHLSYPDVKGTATPQYRTSAHICSNCMGNRHFYKINPPASSHPHNDLPADFLKLQKHHRDICKITQIGVVMIYFDAILHITVKFYHLNSFFKLTGPYIEFWSTINFFLRNFLFPAYSADTTHTQP